MSCRQFVPLLVLSVLAMSSRPAFAEDRAAAPEVELLRTSPLGLDAVTVNGRIQPHGRPTTYYFEYGNTTEYGSRTPAASLPPRLAAYYHESWDDGPGGWTSWGRGPDRGFTHAAEGGAQRGFVRFAEPSNNDPNHDDGIGTLHLSKYAYPGAWGPHAGIPSLQLAAGSPDFRDARISIHVRGNDWRPQGSELQWWTQSQLNPEVGLAGNWMHSNWAYTGYNLTDALLSGRWEHVEYRLLNDGEQWTYGGNNEKQANPGRYTYLSINEAQRRLNVDFFHMLTYVDPARSPLGSIDFDELTITYRNTSLLYSGNGGKLVRAPDGSPDDPARLTDGWRHGPDRMWQSAERKAAAEPLAFIYELEKPVTVRAVQLHQHTRWPSKEAAVSVSDDGQTFTPLAKGTLPEKSPHGPNFAFALLAPLEAKTRFVKVEILSGYLPERWGLGEIEVFGEGAVMRTDDDWVHVNLDILKLQAGATYHYRLVAVSDTGTTAGADATFTLPANQKPLARTGPASRITSGSAKVEGRICPLGLKTQFYFEYGPDAKYGQRTAAAYGGKQITPRTSFAELTGLEPDREYHYRLVAVNEQGVTTGDDGVFRTAVKK